MFIVKTRAENVTVIYVTTREKPAFSVPSPLLGEPMKWQDVAMYGRAIETCKQRTVILDN